MANTQNTQQTINNNAIFQVPTDQEVRAMSKAKAREAIATYEKQKEKNEEDMARLRRSNVNFRDRFNADLAYLAAVREAKQNGATTAAQIAADDKVKFAKQKCEHITKRMESEANWASNNEIDRRLRNGETLTDEEQKKIRKNMHDKKMSDYQDYFDMGIEQINLDQAIEKMENRIKMTRGQKWGLGLATTLAVGAAFFGAAKWADNTFFGGEKAGDKTKITQTATKASLAKAAENKKDVQAKTAPKEATKAPKKAEQAVTATQAEQPAVTAQAEQAAEQKAVPETWQSSFEKAIDNYPADTKEALRMGIEYLQAYQQVVKARASQDIDAEYDAKMEMRRIKDGIRELDEYAWRATNNEVGPYLVEQGKKNPNANFNFKQVSKMLVSSYEQSGSPQAQLVLQEKRFNRLKSHLKEASNGGEASTEKTYQGLPKNYQKAVDASVEMLDRMDRFFAAYMANPKDPTLRSLQVEMDQLGKKIGNAAPVMQVVVAGQTRAIWAEFAKTGSRAETLDIDAYRDRFIQAADQFAKDPKLAEKAIKDFNAMIQAEQAKAAAQQKAIKAGQGR